MSRVDSALAVDAGRATERAARGPRLTVLAQSPPVNTPWPTDPQTEPEPPRSIGERPLPVRRGQLLAVCGLCGGAGASTLAYLVPLAAAREGSEPVLVADTRGTHRRPPPY